MICTGVKLTVERKDGEVTTWHDTLETTVENVIMKVKESKSWGGGRVLNAYLEFSNNGEYVKYFLNVEKSGFDSLLV